MTKAEKIARLKELGVTEDLSAKSAAELDALLAENDLSRAADRAEPEVDDGSDVGKDPRTGRKVAVRVEVSADPGGREDVFLCVNGHALSIKRGQWVDLDEGFVQVLESIEMAEEVPSIENGRVVGTETVYRNRFQVTRKR